MSLSGYDSDSDTAAGSLTHDVLPVRRLVRLIRTSSAGWSRRCCPRHRPNGRATNCQIAIGYCCGCKIQIGRILQNIASDCQPGLKDGCKPVIRSGAKNPTPRQCKDQQSRHIEQYGDPSCASPSPF